MHPTRIFKAPEEMAKAFEEYKADLNIQGEEWLKVQYVGKEGRRVTDKYKIPMTIEGFLRFCYNKYGDVGGYFDNQQNNFNDFIAICSRIKREVRENQIIGGLMGLYNPSITQRLNSLVDKQEIQQTNIEVRMDLGKTLDKPE